MRHLIVAAPTSTVFSWAEVRGVWGPICGCDAKLPTQPLYMSLRLCH